MGAYKSSDTAKHMPHAMFIFTLFLYTLSVSASCLHGTSYQRRETSDGKVKVATFGYSGGKGPLNWAALSPNNSVCSTGTRQSPIVLDETIFEASSSPTLNISPVDEAEFENLGSTLEVIVEGTTTWEGKDYHLAQYHFHTPSEHRIEEEYYPLEMHMVHEADDGSLLVLGIMYDISEDGTTTELLTSTTVHLDEVKEPGSLTHTGKLDFSEIAKALGNKPLYQYTGSLTTPPCREGVTFLIMKEPLWVDVKTYNDLKRIMKFNARYTQNTLGSPNLLQIPSASSTCDVEARQLDTDSSSAHSPAYALLPLGLLLYAPFNLL